MLIGMEAAFCGGMPLMASKPMTPVQELPASAHPLYHRVLAAGDGEVPAGILFDTRNFAIMSMVHPPNSHTPDLNTDKDGDRILVVLEGDLSLQIGANQYLLTSGDAVQIERNTSFGNTRSHTGAHLLLVRGKAMRSFGLYR